MRRKTGGALAAVGLLSACGGSGGGGVGSVSTTPVSSMTTTTTTTTTPVVIDYNDAEYQRSTSASDANAIVAYNAGATGAGITIGIVDSGINLTSAEFAGRISAASAGFGVANAQDVDGHGTAVASVAAAGRNGSDILGVAFDATVLALRVDTAGTCGTSDGCKFNTNNITAAVDTARVNGAKVINLSLGGSAMPASLVAAVNRATAAGIIIVIAAGNDGTAAPDPFAQVANQAAARGLVIIAGSHGSTGAISSFTDKAGGGFAQYYLTALGERVRAPDHTGTDYLWTGTSFSAPEIAGAVALLEQAFPNLTPAQVVALLYSTATDAGDAGVDAVFGNGILNLTKAFQPVGTTSLAGGQVAVTAAQAIVASAAMGDAKVTGAALSHAVVIDQLGRAFSMNLIGETMRTEATRPLVQAISGDIRSGGGDVGPLSLRTTVARGLVGEPQAGLALRGRGYWRDQAVPLSGMGLVRVTPHLAAGFAFASGGQALADLLAPEEGGGGRYLAARGPRDTPGFLGRDARSMALVQALGAWEIGVSAETGTLGAIGTIDPSTPGYTLAGVLVRRRLGPLDLGAGIASLAERATLLGARLGAALGNGGAVTRYADLDARLRLGGGWSLKAQWRQGWTDARTGGVLTSGRLTTSAAAFDAGWSGSERRFGLRYAMPPRVTGGGLGLTVPTSYDYATGVVGTTAARLSLAPAGQERDLEASAGLRIAGGWLDANAYWRRQPGNWLAAPDDLGGAVRYALAF